MTREELIEVITTCLRDPEIELFTGLVGDYELVTAGFQPLDVNNDTFTVEFAFARKPKVKEDMVSIKTRACPGCGIKTEIVVPRENYERYKSGWFAQDAFPMLTDEQREKIITGYCGPCWDYEFYVEEN